MCDLNDNMDIIDAHITKLNNMEIGGRNLAEKHTECFTLCTINKLNNADTCTFTPNLVDVSVPSKKYSKIMINATGNLFLAAGIYYRLNGEYNATSKFVIGHEYTISMYIKANTQCNLSGNQPCLPTTMFSNVTHSNDGGIRNNIATTKWVKYVATGTYTGDNTDAITLYTNKVPFETEIYVSSLKVEAGNKATDWTPAPEDIDERINTHTHAVANAVTNGFMSNINFKRLNWLISRDVNNASNYAGAAMGEDEGRLVRLSEAVYDVNTSANKYFIGIGSSGSLYTGVGLNGANATWREIALANKVGSYETGTWTPTPSYDAQGHTDPDLTGSGTYAKVGRVVFITGWCYNSSASSTGFPLYAITNLPFTPSTMAYGLTARNIVVTDTANDLVTPTGLKFGTYYSNGSLNLRGMTGSNTSSTWYFDGYYYV